MADKSFFGRLQNLFSSSTIIRKAGDKKLKVIYLDDAINVEIQGKLRSGSLDQLISNPLLC